jgi:hypothetical protein
MALTHRMTWLSHTGCLLPLSGRSPGVDGRLGRGYSGMLSIKSSTLSQVRQGRNQR